MQAPELSLTASMQRSQPVPNAGVEEWMRSGGYRKAVAAVAAICGSRTVAEDCVMDAATKCLEVGDVRNVDAWITTTAANRSRSVARRTRTFARKALLLAERSSADTDLAEQGAVNDVLAAINRLPFRQRQVVVLHYYLGWPVTEIAAAIKRSDGAVKHALHAARRTLSQNLPGYGPNDQEID